MPPAPTAGSPAHDDRLGLCARCIHAQHILSANGGRFILCLHAKINNDFPKYPRLPMITCEAYEDKSR